MSRKLLGGVSLVALVVAGPGPGPARAQRGREHPRLHAALHELIEARRELKGARHDFGGHRKKALAAVDDGIKSLRGILRVKGDRVPGVERGREFYKGYKDYPHLRRALRDLREAREELRSARGDFGGLKERGLRDMGRAARQIELAIKSARR
jgi:hypothetical protein